MLAIIGASEKVVDEIMLDIPIKILEIALEIITVYTAVLGICFLIPRKPKPVVTPGTRFAVLLPARNEENVIFSVIDSLKRQDYPEDLYDIIVIPNNCTDDTEGAARRAGAKIMHCTTPVRTKGEVLHQIFAQLMGQYDAYCVFDADNVVDAAFLSRMHDAVAAGALVAKSRQCALNPYDNWVSGCYDLYFQNINLFHSRARAAFSLSAKLIGTGFMVTDRLLQQMGGWQTYTLTEDIEFAAQCAERGVQVHYVPEALTYDEQPLSFRVSLRQRRRWSAGVQSVANRYIGRLLSRRPSWLRWDLAAHISMIYVQLLALVPVVYALLFMPLLSIVSTLLISLASFWAGTTAMGLFLAVTAGRNPLKMWKAIIMYPAYIISWYPLHIWALFAKPKDWKPIHHGTSKQRVKEHR